MKMKSNYTATIGCGFWIGLMLVNLLLGGYSTNYILSWFGKDIPMFFDCIIGLIGGEIAIPVAVIGWILKSLSVF